MSVGVFLGEQRRQPARERGGSRQVDLSANEMELPPLPLHLDLERTGRLGRVEVAHQIGQGAGG